MSQSKGNISIHAKNIMPIIKRWLYSDKDIFIREMVSNGCDAIVKQKLAHPDKEDAYQVTVTLDIPAKQLRFTDNGIGMTEDEVKKYINQVAFSSAEEFLKNYEGDDKGGIIGHFGLGFYSAFMVAKKVTIQTFSDAEGAAPVQWESEDGMKYKLSEGNRETRGTEITLDIAGDEEEFLEEYKVKEVLKRYCGFMAQPVYFDVIKPEEPKEEAAKEGDAEPAAEKPEAKQAPVLINDVPALWLKQPKDCTDEEYRDFYKKVFHVYDEPLFYVHLNVDYPFNLKGILYFPKLTNDFGTREGEIKLFSGQVFVADNIKEVIPDFLMLLKGVIDCPDLPLNVSRSFLQNDGYVKKLSAYITRKVADRLTGLFKNEREDYQKYWDDIHPFVKYGCVRDAKFFDMVKDSILYKTTKGDYLTLQEYLAKNEGKLGKKVVYASDPTRQSASIAMYEKKEIDVVVLDALIDLNFVSFIEYSAGVEGLSFVRVDGDAATFTKDEEADEETKKKTEEDEKTLKALFEEATGNKELEVKLQTLTDEGTSALLVQDEQGRRFSDMSKIYGQDFKMPERHTLVLNRADSVVQRLLGEEDTQTKSLIAAQLYDLARMSVRPLEKEEITAFLNRSNQLLKMVK
ncbi:MAG TPA: molecular chaperone HtpG [Candidatus Limiplasma sp.]|nr:molecular chaperone HtpG [Candidatus Limiplasma sp.]